MILTGTCLLSVVVMIWTLTAGQKPGEFVPPSFEAQVQSGVPETDVELETFDIGVFQFMICKNPEIVNGKARIWLVNPAENHVWLRLRILDADGGIVGKSGLVRPGEYLAELTLDSELKAGVKVELKVMSYEPDTYYSAGAVSLFTTVWADDE